MICKLGSRTDADEDAVMTQHRNTYSTYLTAVKYPELQRRQTEPSLRVLVFCAGSMSGSQDVSFPYNCELKVNGDDVKANFRGLKNKPARAAPTPVAP